MKGFKFIFISYNHIWRLSALHWSDIKFFSYHIQSQYAVLFVKESSSVLKLDTNFTPLFQCEVCASSMLL